MIKILSKLISKNACIIIGTGGHSRVISRLISLNRKYQIYGHLEFDPNKKIYKNELIYSNKIIDYYKNIKKYIDLGIKYFFLAIGDNYLRYDIFNDLRKHELTFPNLLHPSVLIDETCVIGKGSVISVGAILCNSVIIGNFSIINTGTIIDHESTIGNFCHLAPGVKVAGRCTINDHTFIGISSTIIENIFLEKNITVGASSNVLKSCKVDGAVLIGNPAKIK